MSKKMLTFRFYESVATNRSIEPCMKFWKTMLMILLGYWLRGIRENTPAAEVYILLLQYIPKVRKCEPDTDSEVEKY